MRQLDPQQVEQERISREYQEATARDRGDRGERDGVVVTPPEIVDFINRAVRDLILKHWGVGIDEVTTIEDPFAGTAIFCARLLETIDKDQVQGVVDRMRCIEIDPDAADIAEHNLRSIIYARGGTPPLDRRLVIVADTFATNPQETPCMDH